MRGWVWNRNRLGVVDRCCSISAVFSSSGVTTLVSGVWCGVMLGVYGVGVVLCNPKGDRRKRFDTSSSEPPKAASDRAGTESPLLVIF